MRGEKGTRANYQKRGRPPIAHRNLFHSPASFSWRTAHRSETRAAYRRFLQRFIAERPDGRDMQICRTPAASARRTALAAP
jgi:hypothetical protein